MKCKYCGREAVRIMCNICKDKHRIKQVKKRNIKSKMHKIFN